MPTSSNLNITLRTPFGASTGTLVGSVWHITAKGDLSDIFAQALAAGASTIAFPSGTYRASSQFTIPTGSNLTLAPNSPGAEVTLIAKAIIEGGIQIRVTGITLQSLSDAPGFIPSTGTPPSAVDQASIILENVTLLGATFNAATPVLTVFDGFYIEAYNVVIRANSGSSPALLVDSTTDRGALRATGFMAIEASGESGVALRVNPGPGEILGNAASWDVNGTIEFLGDHAVAVGEPAKYLFGDTRVRLTAAAASTRGVIAFGDDAEDATNNAGNAFVSFDSIDFEVGGNFATGNSIAITGLPDDANESELDVDQDITLRIGRWTENIVPGGTVHGAFQANITNDHTINGQALGATDAQPVNRGVARGRLN